jgi:hypothetical protein
MTKPVGWAVVFSLTVFLATGCSSRPKPIGESSSPETLNPEEEAIHHVSLAYREACTALKKAPTGVKDLKPFLKQYGDPDHVLISPNDGQPYEIAWGTMPMRPPRNTKANPVLISEKTGKDGKRYVVDFMLRVRHVTDEEFQTLRGPGAG